jgi:hypothetical protein
MGARKKRRSNLAPAEVFTSRARATNLLLMAVGVRALAREDRARRLLVVLPLHLWVPRFPTFILRIPLFVQGAVQLASANHHTRIVATVSALLCLALDDRDVRPPPPSR